MPGKGGFRLLVPGGGQMGGGFGGAGNFKIGILVSIIRVVVPIAV